MSDRLHYWLIWLIALGMLAFAIYYPFKFLTVMVPFDLGAVSNWQDHWLIDDDADIPAWWRATHFVLWVPSVLATEAMLLFSLWLMAQLMRGLTFDSAVVRTMQRIGISAGLAATFWLAAAPFDAFLLTAYNAEEIRPIRFHFDSGEIGLALAGLGVFLLARVLYVTVLLKTENQEMI